MLVYERFNERKLLLEVMKWAIKINKLIDTGGKSGYSVGIKNIERKWENWEKEVQEKEWWMMLISFG